MRHIYELTDETRKVLTGYQQTIAEEMEVSDKHIYAILAGTETDPFAKLTTLFSAATRAGAPVDHWLNRLNAIKQRYESLTNSGGYCLADETADLAKEVNDVVVKHLQGHSYYEQLMEVCEAEQQLAKTKRCLLDAINAEKDQTNGNRSRIRSVA